MIVGIPKRNALAFSRVLNRETEVENVVTPRPRLGLFAAFALMMERQAALFIRGLGE